MGWTDALGIRAFTGQPAVVRTKSKRAPARWRYWPAAKAAPEPETIKGGVMGIGDALAAVLRLSEAGAVGSPGAALRAYEASSAIAIPVNIIAEAFGSAKIVLENLDTGDIEKRHDILNLLRNPHPSMPGALFLEFIAKMFLITGEAPIVAGGPFVRPPVFLRPLNPQDCSPMQDSEFGWAESWEVSGPALRGVYRTELRDQGAVWRNGPMRELRVIRSFSTRDASMFRGQSKLVPASKDVRQQIEGADYNIALLSNGGRPSLFISLKNRVSAEVFEEIKKGIRDRFEGSANAGRIAITNGGELDVKEAKSSNRDMEFGESLSRTAQTIAKVYKVPVVLLNMDAATFSNMETATLALWDDAILPMSNYLLGDLSAWLFPRFKLDPDQWRLTVDIEQIGALRARRQKELAERAKSGLESINEIRASMPGREDVEGGDEILVGAGLQPLSVVSASLDAMLQPTDGAPDMTDEEPDDDEAPPARGKG